MIDLARIKARAAWRLDHAAHAAPPANPANRLTEGEPASQLAALAGGAATDASGYLDRRDRLLRWGWPAAEAERVALRLAGRDADDGRVVCAQCHHYQAPPRHRCGNHRAAGLMSPDVGRELAVLPQRCPGFQPAGCAP